MTVQFLGNIKTWEYTKESFLLLSIPQIFPWHYCVCILVYNVFYIRAFVRDQKASAS